LTDTTEDRKRNVPSIGSGEEGVTAVAVVDTKPPQEPAPLQGVVKEALVDAGKEGNAIAVKCLVKDQKEFGRGQKGLITKDPKDDLQLGPRANWSGSNEGKAASQFTISTE